MSSASYAEVAIEANARISQGKKNSCSGLCIVSYPDPDSQQLRVDYITATWKVGLAHRSNFFVLWILDFGEPIKLQPVVTSRCYLIMSVITFHS